MPDPTDFHRSPDGRVGQTQGALDQHVDELGIMLADWSHRHHHPQAHGDRLHPRRAAARALDEIDTITRTLHEMRAALIDQVRQYDNDTAQRTDALLARRRAQRGEAR